MSYSPWGAIQHSTQHAPGFRSVSTAGHGGFMISKNFADEHLSKAAKGKGRPYSGYLCYEEDCDWAIPALELPEFWPEIFEYSPEDVQRDPHTYLMNNLSRWNPEYLLERGIAPLLGPYQSFLNEQEAMRVRREKSPNLIVCATGDWHKRVPEGAVEVETADGMRHLITKDSYAIREPNLLSLCTLYLEEMEETTDV